MGEIAGLDPLLAVIDGPAAVCDPRGTILRQNAAFVAWAGAQPGDRVDIHAARGLLVGPEGAPRPLTMVGLAGGGWLAVPAGGDAPTPASSVSRVVARRLERVERSLESNAAMGLMESPPGPVAACLRDLLATAQELRAVRAQVESIAGTAPAQHGPSCLRSVLRDVVGALPDGGEVSIVEAGTDWTVAADHARLFAHLVSLLGVLVQAGPVRANLRGGDPVRLQVVSLGTRAADPFAGAEPAIDAARRYLALHGGRVLAEGGCLILELPAWARNTGISDGTFAGTVLVADDDESTLAMMGAVLRRAGFRVLTAENGVAASALLRAHADEIVAVVADAVLPGCSGVELAGEARRCVPEIPVLLVSGHPSDLLGAADVPGLPLLSKPFGARALADHVRKLLTSES